MTKKFYLMSLLFILLALPLALTSCGDDNDLEKSGIAGTWKREESTLTLGKDGSYREDFSDVFSQYRVGTYTYNDSQKIMVTDIGAVEGNNGAYQDVFIVQTLTETTLVLLYPDGDVKGYYTRVS